MAVAYGARVSFMGVLLMTLDTLTLRLYVNNITPDASLDVTQFTEASGSWGYAAVPLNAWGAAFLNGANRGETDHPPIVFTNTLGSGELVYGYFVTDGSGAWYFAERDPSAPVDMTSLGAVYPISPVFKDDQGSFS